MITMQRELASSKLEEVQELLAHLELQSSKEIREELGISGTVQSLDEVYACVKHYSHGAYIALWFFGLLAKDQVPWALEQVAQYARSCNRRERHACSWKARVRRGDRCTTWNVRY